MILTERNDRVREREKEREGGSERDRGRERERQRRLYRRESENIVEEAGEIDLKRKEKRG